jgi:hypothetical protein
MTGSALLRLVVHGSRIVPESIMSSIGIGERLIENVLSTLSPLSVGNSTPVDAPTHIGSASALLLVSTVR